MPVDGTRPLLVVHEKRKTPTIVRGTNAVFRLQENDKSFSATGDSAFRIRRKSSLVDAATIVACPQVPRDLVASGILQDATK